MATNGNGSGSEDAALRTATTTETATATTTQRPELRPEMRGMLWLLIVSLPVAMLTAAGLLAIDLALCARALPQSPFYELAEVAIESVLVTGSLAGVREPLLEQGREVMLWVAPLGTISCLIGGLAGGAMSRDANRAWFALTPLLMLPVALLRLDPWTVGVALLWAAAAVAGASVVRRRAATTATAATEATAVTTCGDGDGRRGTGPRPTNDHD